ncbi:MAG: hypothetical protein IKG83_00040, partial [Prevotella sp.]|nr:hypothetical protein [Prevotella sp.]
DRAVCGDGDKNMQKFNRLLQLLQQYDMSKFDDNLKTAAETIINAIRDDNMFADLRNPYNQAERAIMRAKFMRDVLEHVENKVIVAEVLKETFKVCPNILSYFDFSQNGKNEG